MTVRVVAPGASVKDEEIAAVAEVLRSGGPSAAGRACAQFEHRLATTVGTRHALATASGGSALFLALRVLGAGPGDEVIVADYTRPATVNAVLHTGARPVFADVEPRAWCVDPAALGALVTPRTVGIVVVDVAGQPGALDAYRTVAGRNGLWLVEDSCALGARFGGRHVGGIADLTVFPFPGHGGALVGDQPELFGKARRLHADGGVAVAREVAELSVPDVPEPGYDVRMSEVHAALLTVRLQRRWLALGGRRAVAERYHEGFAGLPGVKPPEQQPGREHAWQSYLLTITAPLNRDDVAERVRAQGVPCSFGLYAAHLQRAYRPRRRHRQRLAVAEAAFARHLSLPVRADFTPQDVDRVIRVVRESVA